MKDPRYNIIKSLISDGHVESFSDIFKFLPKTIVAGDLGLNAVRFNRLIENVEDLRIRQVYDLARLCNMEAIEFFKLIDRQHELNNRKSRK